MIDPRMLAVAMIVAGLLCLVGPSCFYFWAHHTYTTGLSVAGWWRVGALALAGLALVVGGAFLARSARV